MKYPNRIFGADAAPYTSHNTQQFPMGQVMELPNGKIFRYGGMGATVGVANKLYQTAAPNGNWDALAVVTAALAASTMVITVAGTAMLENDLAEGSAVVETAAALGHCYPIKSNTAASGADTTITLADGVTVQAALTTSHTVTLERNPWRNVVIMASPQTALIVGIPLVVIAVAGYGWFQTHGVCSCVVDAETAATPADNLRPGEKHDGSVAIADHEAATMDQGEIAWNMFTTPDDDFGHIFLMVE